MVRLATNQYRIKIAEQCRWSRGEMSSRNSLMAMDSGLARGKVRGIETREPAFNTPAVWIDPARAIRPKCSVTPSSSPPACWQRISRKSSAGIPMNC